MIMDMVVQHQRTTDLRPITNRHRQRLLMQQPLKHMMPHKRQERSFIFLNLFFFSFQYLTNNFCLVFICSNLFYYFFSRFVCIRTRLFFLFYFIGCIQLGRWISNSSVCSCTNQECSTTSKDCCNIYKSNLYFTAYHLSPNRTNQCEYST